MKFLHKTGSPAYFYWLSGRIIPWLWVVFAVLTTWGLYQAFFVAPSDYQQGESYRIIYIHVPAAWLSMMIYLMMAIFGAIGLIWRIRIAEILAISSAPIGAAFALIALITGAVWGKPTWGTYWVWDARLTSQLVLFFLYLGVMGLHSAIDEPRKAARAAAMLALVGVVNLPIIHYSVEWWNTLHQGTTIKIIGESKMPSSMLFPLLLMAVATKFYFGAALLSRARNRLLDQDRRRGWVAKSIREQRL
ncbi:MAG: heme ABC transporter permease [Xanthomonadales bacterium]|nr:heme ABC transporter permease [Xanthomonadales bacterium]